jgi:hypothetical protein
MFCVSGAGISLHRAGRIMKIVVRKPVLPGLAIILLVTVTLLPVFGAEEQVIQQASASESRILDPFTVNGPWEARWQTRGPRFMLVIHEQAHPNQAGEATVVSITGSGTGSSSRSRGGKFYLEITAQGDWRVSVVQLP